MSGNVLFYAEEIGKLIKRLIEKGGLKNEDLRIGLHERFCVVSIWKSTIFYETLKIFYEVSKELNWEVRLEHFNRGIEVRFIKDLRKDLLDVNKVETNDKYDM